MTKTELLETLKKHIDAVNVGIQADKHKDVFPRIVLSELEWIPHDASGDEYMTEVIYQISFFTKVPRDSKILAIRKELKEKGVITNYYHEYIEEGSFFHTATTVSVIEDLEEDSNGVS